MLREAFPLIRASSPVLLERLCRGRGLELWPQFISGPEEEALLRDVEPGLYRKHYQRDHWDQVRKPGEGEGVAGRTARTSLSPRHLFPITDRVPQLSMVHVLDLEKTGFIKAHVDSVK
eukprot:g19570.t1